MSFLFVKKKVLSTVACWILWNHLVRSEFVARIMWRKNIFHFWERSRLPVSSYHLMKSVEWDNLSTKKPLGGKKQFVVFFEIRKKSLLSFIFRNLKKSSFFWSVFKMENHSQRRWSRFLSRSLSRSRRDDSDVRYEPLPSSSRDIRYDVIFMCPFPFMTHPYIFVL